MISLSLSVFFTSLLTIMVARKIAPKVGLVDIPKGRKKHVGRIPLVGGISFFVGLLTYFILDRHNSFLNSQLMICVIILLATGILDDIHDLSAKFRLLVQMAVAFIAFDKGIAIRHLGEILPGYNISLSYFPSMILTVFAIVGAINAFNMMDGMNGLLGFVTMVFCTSTLVLAMLNDNPQSSGFLLSFIFAIAPYLLFNMGFFNSKRRIFMGDSGSMIIGFLVACHLIIYSHGSQADFHPTTVIWFFAVPLMDSLLTMGKRVMQGRSPLAPGRDHIHHTVLGCGASFNATLTGIVIASVFFAGVGAFFATQEKYIQYSVSLFLIVFSIYAVTLHLLPLVGGKRKRLVKVPDA